jgi:outer membrane protein assembly factor BamB
MRLFVAAAFASMLVAVAAFPAPAVPEPWPRWRGRDGAGQGGERRFAEAWTEADWAWTAPLPGRGHASPVIHGGRIFTASADEAAGRRFVSCHALVDGKLVWSREIVGPIDPHHAQNSSASGSVAVDERGCYWMWAAHDGLRVEAFTLDGEPKWHADLGPSAREHGFGNTPAVWRDLLIVPNDQDGASFVAALDTTTGRERWRLPRESGKASYATPLVVDGDAGPQIVLASQAHGLTGVEPTTGRVLWERKCLPKRAVSSPMLAGPLAIATCGDGGGDNTLVGLRLPGPRGDRDAVPEIAFTLDRSVACYVPTPLVVGHRLYLWGDRGVVTCVDAATGAVKWRGRVGGSYSASPVEVGGTVRNVSADGEVVVIAEGDAFEVLGRTPLGEECRATPAVAGGRMVYRTTGRLLAVDAAP